MCQTKDDLKRQQLEDRDKKYKRNLLKLTRRTNAKHDNNFFSEKQINLVQNLGRHMGNH